MYFSPETNDIMVFWPKTSGIMAFGLSATPMRAKGFTLVRWFVRSFVRSFVRPCVTLYLENRASDFDDFLHKAVS